MTGTNNSRPANPGQNVETRGDENGVDKHNTGTRAAAVYALVAHRLTAFYDEGYWITLAQGATLCSEWLARAKKTLPLAERKHLSHLSELIATRITGTLSREAGLFTAYELMESLDPRHVSEVGSSIMDECVRMLSEHESDTEEGREA